MYTSYMSTGFYSCLLIAEHSVWWLMYYC